MRLIDAESLWDEIEKDWHDTSHHKSPQTKAVHRGEYNHFLYAIAKQPTVDAEVIHHAQWISFKEKCNRNMVKCSRCGNTLDMDGVNVGRGDANYCPNCGSKMDTNGRAEEEEYKWERLKAYPF